MVNCSLLFHRGTAWDGAVQGSTNVLARLFLRAGYPVAWMPRLQHLGHCIRGRRFPPAARRSGDGALVISAHSIFPRITRRWMTPRMWFWMSSFPYRTIRPPLDRVFERHNQPTPAVIWTAGGDAGALRRYFPGARRIVQCVDLYEAFHGPSQNLLEERDYTDADAVVAIGHSLAQFLREHRSVRPDKLTVIGQGVATEAYAELTQEPDDLRRAARPRLVWVGVGQKADRLLMQAALDGLAVGQGSLVLIGPLPTWAQEWRARDARVCLLGPRLPDQVPRYLQHCDVGLMLYDQSAPPLKYFGQNPLKLYEFAAAGLPILSTPHEEYRHLHPPVAVVRSTAEVQAQLQEALRRQAELGELAKRFAPRHTWQQRFEEARSLVDRLAGFTSSGHRSGGVE